MASGIEIRPAHFPGRPPIDAYGNGGFRFADMSHRGSLLLLPSGVHGWNLVQGDELNAAALEKVLAEAADIEFLLVGTGISMKPLPRELRDVLKEAGVSADPMTTGAAVRTYNIMLSEERAVAAALIAVD